MFNLFADDQVRPKLRFQADTSKVPPFIITEFGYPTVAAEAIKCETGQTTIPGEFPQAKQATYYRQVLRKVTQGEVAKNISGLFFYRTTFAGPTSDGHTPPAERDNFDTGMISDTRDDGESHLGLINLDNPENLAPSIFGKVDCDLGYGPSAGSARRAFCAVTKWSKRPRYPVRYDFNPRRNDC